MKINWNGFLKIAVEKYPEEVCAFLFSKKPYSPEEEWYVFPIKNVSKNTLIEWLPDKKEMLNVKKEAIKIGLVKIGNIHTHPMKEESDIEEEFLPSEKDLSYARKFNDVVRGILLVGKNTIYGIKFHDKFGNEVNITVESKDVI